MFTVSQRIEEQFRKRIGEELAKMVDDLSYGNMFDHGEYKRHCGQIKGLRLALEILDDVKKKTERGD